MSSDEAPKSIDVKKVGDNLAVRRPALYLLTLNQRLAEQGDAVIQRFFDILTDPATEPKIWLRFFKELNNIMNVKEIGALMLALQRKGRPSDEEDPDDVERRKVYAEILTRNTKEAVTDAEFEVKPAAAPPKRRRTG